MKNYTLIRGNGRIPAPRFEKIAKKREGSGTKGNIEGKGGLNVEKIYFLFSGLVVQNLDLLGIQPLPSDLGHMLGRVKNLFMMSIRVTV